MGDKIVEGVNTEVGAIKDLGAKVVQGVEDLPAIGESASTVVKGKDSKLAGPIGSLLGIGVGGQFTFDAMAMPPEPGFPVGTVAFGQFSAKCSIKFKPTLLSSVKAPKAKEAERGIKEICVEIYKNASFKWFGGATVKGDKKSAGVGAGFLKIGTKIGEVSLEIKAFDISLDIKKIVKASVGSTSATFPLFEREYAGVRYEIDFTIAGSLDISPNPAAGAEAFTSGGILLAIDVALVAGPPLAAAAVIGVGIVMAGEKGARDAAILEGAADARHAAWAYAFTMVGNEAKTTGPRAKAAVEVAMQQLARVAASRGIAIDVLMKELSKEKNAGKDMWRIETVARHNIFSSYYAEARFHIQEWRKKHSVMAAFSTEEDDIAAIDAQLEMVFEH